MCVYLYVWSPTHTAYYIFLKFCVLVLAYEFFVRGCPRTTPCHGGMVLAPAHEMCVIQTRLHGASKTPGYMSTWMTRLFELLTRLSATRLVCSATILVCESVSVGASVNVSVSVSASVRVSVSSRLNVSVDLDLLQCDRESVCAWACFCICLHV